MIRFILFIIIFCSCGAQKSITMAHVERIEEKMMPIPIGADTIEIELCRDARLERPMTREGQNRHNIQPVGRTDTACRVPTIESVRSTRALSMTKTITDTTSTLRITLRPDTVFVPYINHIRSDTIVVPDRICNEKLNHTNMTNLFLILILIAIIIIFLKNRMTR